MKKIFLLFLFLTLTLVITGCDREARDVITEVEVTVQHKYADLAIPPDFEPIKGLKIKESNSQEWIVIPGISGFDYVENFEYRLKLEKTKLADPPMDLPSDTTYKLLEILSKEPK